MDTANYGFITNYENKPRAAISNRKYKRANLLLEYLKQQRAFYSNRQYKEYLHRFLDEGEGFNGTNIWLGNLIES